MIPVCVCSCIWFLVFVFDSCLYIMSCCVSCFDFPCLVSHVLIFHALMCPLSFSYVLPSGSLCLLSCSLHVFSCAPPPRYLTWLPPLSSPVPRHVISACVFSLCVPLTPCPVFVCLGLFWAVRAPV